MSRRQAFVAVSGRMFCMAAAALPADHLNASAADRVSGLSASGTWARREETWGRLRPGRWDGPSNKMPPRRVGLLPVSVGAAADLNVPAFDARHSSSVFER
jgi:hypothetical protein